MSQQYACHVKVLSATCTRSLQRQTACARGFCSCTSCKLTTTECVQMTLRLQAFTSQRGALSLRSVATRLLDRLAISTATSRGSTLLW